MIFAIFIIFKRLQQIKRRGEKKIIFYFNTSRIKVANKEPIIPIKIVNIADIIKNFKGLILIQSII